MKRLFRPNSIRTINSDRRIRGVTLIELMIGAAIAGVIMVAASGVMVSMTKMRREARTRMERMTQVFSGLTSLERSILNTGYHLPAARYAFAVRNNLVVGTSLASDGGGLQVGIPPCGSPVCIVPNTDVLEIRQGPDRPFMTVTSVNTVAGSLNIVGQYLGGPLAAVPNTDPRIVLFVDEDGRNCIGTIPIGGFVVTASNATLVNVTMVDNTLSPDVTAPFNIACPSVNMSVSVYELGFRYFAGSAPADVSADGGFNSISYGLYRQRDQQGSAPGYQVVPEEVISGIDNFQAIPVVQRRDGGACSSDGGSLCECNTNGALCTLDHTARFSVADYALADKVVGVKVIVSSQGDMRQRGDVSAAPIRLADETVAAADTFVRTVQTQTYYFRNFSQVQP